MIENMILLKNIGPWVPNQDLQFWLPYPEQLRSNGYSMWPAMYRTEGELDFAQENFKTC